VICFDARRAVKALKGPSWQLGVLHILEELGVLLGGQGVPSILVAHRAIHPGGTKKLSCFG
jgi:hypothetical protein